MGATRLAHIEPHPTEPATDVRLFECVACGAMQAFVRPVGESDDP
jgi:hypothetical protein